MTTPTRPDSGPDHAETPLLRVVQGYPVADLVEWPGNARRHDTDVLDESVAAHGQFRSVLARELPDGRLQLLAGHGTRAALERAGRTHIDVEVRAVADDAQARRIVLVDNRANDRAGYDELALLDLLDEADRDGGLAGTGFDRDAYEALLDEVGSENPHDWSESGSGGDPDDADVTPPAAADVVTEPGDVWVLGPHRIVCGDCRDAGTVTALLDGAAVNLAFTSPPYADARKYDESSGFKPIPPDEYVAWFAPVQAAVRDHLASDGSWFVNIKAKADGLDTPLYVLDLVIAHVREWGWHFATEFCWERVGMPKSVTRRFKNQFEPVYQFATGPWKIRPEAVQHESDSAIRGVGKGGGNTSWGDDLSNRGFDDSRIGPGMAFPGNRLPPFASQSTGHTAAFPVGLPSWFMKAFTDPGDIVFDPFMGSGTTLVAAQIEGRVAYGTEISPGYCDVIARRFQQLTGELPYNERLAEPVDLIGRT